jgi:hypothetical protein
MKVSDIILQNDFSGLQDLVVQNIVLTGKENQTLEGIHEVSPCSSEDMVWTGISKVMIQEQSPHHGIVHITLHTLCKLNAQLKEMAMASPKILFGSKIPAKVFHVILRRMACTFQQQYSLEDDSSPSYSQWKASELAAAIDIVPLFVPIFDKN